MCEWGTSVPLTVTVPAHLSHTGEAREKAVDVDACIAPIVAALNAAGIHTANSCCGHGARPGSIVLHDGRTLVIMNGTEPLSTERDALLGALRRLTFAARTSGGTAGPDAELMAACDEAEALLTPSVSALDGEAEAQT